MTAANHYSARPKRPAGSASRPRPCASAKARPGRPCAARPAGGSTARRKWPAPARSPPCAACSSASAQVARVLKGDPPALSRPWRRTTLSSSHAARWSRRWIASAACGRTSPGAARPPSAIWPILPGPREGRASPSTCLALGRRAVRVARHPRADLDCQPLLGSGETHLEHSRRRDPAGRGLPGPRPEGGDCRSCAPGAGRPDPRLADRGRCGRVGGAHGPAGRTGGRGAGRPGRRPDRTGPRPADPGGPGRPSTAARTGRAADRHADPARPDPGPDGGGAGGGDPLYRPATARRCEWRPGPARPATRPWPAAWPRRQCRSAPKGSSPCGRRRREAGRPTSISAVMAETCRATTARRRMGAAR